MPGPSLRRLAALALSLALAACGPATLNADVTRFTALPPVAPALSFTVMPDQAQRGGLEFQHYAEMVAERLVRRGWRPLPAGADADAVVTLHWGLGQPSTVITQEPAPLGGWGRHPWYGAEPFPAWETRTETTFPKWLAVDIEDGPAWRAGEHRMLFEGRAATLGRSQSAAPAIPHLIRAVFTDFPGINGQTVRVAVPLNQP